MNTTIIVTIVLSILPVIICINAQIPKHILECYRNNMTDIYNNIKMPMTMPVLIELLQKLESRKSLNMRLLTESLVYRMKFDGIQRLPSAIETENTIPVGPTSIHFNKFKLLLNYLLSGNDQLFPSQALTQPEFCLLHKMISSSVQAWERGDEAKTCPQVKLLPNDRNSNRLIHKNQKSVCPIEKGVVKTHWGDVSPGHILTAILAALQNQDVKLMQILNALDADEHTEIISNITRNTRKSINDEINNLWATTLAGDLGEVISYQRVFVKQLIFGAATTGMWNESLLPRTYYLPDTIGNHWEMTLPESLGGIDGAIIGSEIKAWTDQIGRLRFSQILDMYYSKRGVHFNEKIRACQRKENIQKILKGSDLVKQTTSMAKLLQYYYQTNPSEEWIPIQEEQIEGFCKEAVEEFQQSLNALTETYSACEKGYDMPPSDIFVVIDGTYTGYDGRKLIGSLAQTSDVSRFGSRMGIISGSNGQWMTNFTNSLYQIFEDLARNDDLWPTSLSVPSGLSTIINFLSNKTDKECMDKYRSTRTSVILILSPTATISSIDLENTKSLVKTIKSLNPSTALYYLTSELTKTSYHTLDRNEYLNDKIITTSVRIEAITEKISEELKNSVGQIIELHCDTNKLQYEDYVIPKIIKTYEIPYKILEEANNIIVEFSGHEYGNLSICANDKASPEHKLCQWIDERNTSVHFNTKELCGDDQSCTVQFRVNLVNSRNKCTDDECRYPDQGRLQILTTWSASNSLSANLTFIFLVISTVFICNM